ncbi:mono-functional DNA-alkylating methyl methanesulfonate N-term-domain-containing protein [Mycena polygramma]|nr:mono-functional DNA-alkylating methyl methanesulfonate N-term-domain-containing protein [Mycena polygramma]
MKIVSTFHQPSSVLCSLKCHLTANGPEHLVVAKLDGIEIYSVLPEGLKHQCRWDVWGNILAVKSVPSTDSRSNLIVMLDHPEPELIFLTYTQGTLSITKRLALAEINLTQRPAEFFNDIIVHPDGNLAIVCCYTGKLKVVALKNGNYKSDFDASVMDLSIISIAFLPSPDECSIAILHYDHNRRIQLHARTVSEDDISHQLSTVLQPTPISTKVLPYPEENIPKLITVPCPRDFANVDPEDDESESFIGGVLLVGGTRILLFDLLSARGQAKQQNKRRKLERGKESGVKAEVEKASQKQRERETRRRKPKAFVEWPWSEVTAWCALDGEPLRYLIGDCYGRLSMLSLHDVPNNGLVLIPLGETSSPTTLTYLANQILYVGSHAGDSQLVQISSTPLSSSDENPTLPIPPEIETVAAARLAPPSAKGKGSAETLRDCVLDVKGSFLRVIETFKNIAPIMDATLVDTDNSGHRQIVTCSGGQNTGSIHVIRKGADFQQLATVSGMPHTVGVFSLRTTSDAAFHSHVLVSTVQETYAFELAKNDVLEGTDGFVEDERTLAARNIKRTVYHDALKRGNAIVAPARTELEDTALVVQVTASGAFLLEYDMVGFTRAHHYNIKERNKTLKVVAASINDSQTILALSDGTLLCLEVTRDKTFVLKATSDTILHSEVSALSCIPVGTSSDYLAVAYWKTNDIEILRQVPGKGSSGRTFELVCRTNPLGAVVRSLLLYDFGTSDDSHPYLVAGLGDGSLVTFAWNEQQGTLGKPSLASLGALPVCFTPYTVGAKNVLFAAGSRAMVLSWERDSIRHSPVILKEVMAVAQINVEDKYDSSLILANDSALFIGRVRDIGEMHIRSIPLGLDAPQRIVYEPSLKVFGVACTRREPTRIGFPELAPRSSFRLLDDTTFSHLSQYNCEPDEEITCVTSLTLKQGDASTPFFCLGTYVFRPEEKTPEAGRLLVFTAYPHKAETWSSNLELSLAASADVQGCVYAITTVNGLIAAGVDSAVMLYQLDMDPSTKHCRLSNVSTINLNYFATSLASYENKLVLGDQISSVSLLEVSASKELKMVARDMSPLSPVSVQAINGKHIIAATDTLNLVSFTLDEGTKKLDCDGFYYQSDLVNKFVPGSITAPDAGSKLEPVQLFFTASGRIGVIVDIADRQLGLNLTGLQRNMANVLEDGDKHTQFRTPHSNARRRNTETAVGFLDGDFLERLLVTSPAQLAEIIAGKNDAERLKQPLPEIRQLVKSLQALH